MEFKSFSICLAGCFFYLTIYCQEKKPVAALTWQERAEQETVSIQTVLKLDTIHTQHVKEIQQRYNKSVDSAYKLKTNYDSIAGIVKKLRREREKSLKKVLTAEQLSIYSQQREALRQRMVSRLSKRKLSPIKVDN